MQRLIASVVFLTLVQFATALSPRHHKGLIQGRDTIIDIVTNFTCPGNGAWPASDCDKYYTCYDASPVYLWQCRDDYLFDLTYDGCNFPELVECDDRTRPGSTTAPSGSTTVNTNTTSTNPGTTTPGGFSCSDDGFYPISPGACSNSYIACVDGTAYPQTCPGNAIFDEDRGFCAQPETVPCSSNTTTSHTTVTGTSAGTTEGPFTCPQPDGTFPDPSNCNQFYVCSGGVPNVTQCPPGLVFNPTASVCDFPSNVPGCGGEKRKHQPRYL